MRYLKVCIVVFFVVFSFLSMASFSYGIALFETTGGRSLTAGGGIEGSGGYAGLELSWQVTPVGDLWFYQYKFNESASPAIRFFVLGLSKDCIDSPADPNCIRDSSQTPQLSFFTATFIPGMPGSIKGVMFDFGSGGLTSPYTVTFYSDRSPVYGDFYILDNTGKASAYNTGLINPSSLNFVDFIARPDGTGEVPEPAVLLLLGLGLVAIAIWGFKKRRKKV